MSSAGTTGLLGNNAGKMWGKGEKSMKKICFLGLGTAMFLALGVAQVALAGTPPGEFLDAKKDCIGYCVSQGFNDPMPVSEFARLHTPTDGSGCGMTVLIRDAAPPQPHQ